jgi:hypothetical protein
VALVTCPDCGNQVSDLAPSCIKCGRPLGDRSTPAIKPIFPPSPTPPQQKKSTSLWVVVGLIFVGFFLVVKVQTSQIDKGNVSTAMAPGPSIPALKADSAPTKSISFVPYAERVTHARSVEEKFRAHLSKSKDPPLPDKEIKGAISEASSVPASDPSFADAKKVLARFDEDEKKDETLRRAEMARQDAIEGPKSRKEIAAKFQHEFLMKGMDATFVAQGTGATTLHITYIFVGRPLIEQLQTDGTFLQACTAAGFKKVTFTDGYDKSWTFTL